jgi:sucrose-6-phosphate hydrolase SacC (GH32 family)
MVPYGVGLLEVPKGAYDGKRNVIWGWMWDQEGFVDEGDGKWGGTLSMAREIYAGKDGELHQRPVQEVVNYFNKPVSGISSELDEPKELKVPANYMLHCQVSMEQNSIVTIGFREQPGDDKTGYQLIVSPASGTIELKNSGNRSAKFNCKLDMSRPIDVRAFVNNDIIECFVNDAHAVSIHAYNYRSGQLSFNWDGHCEVRELTVSTAGSDRK